MAMMIDAKKIDCSKIEPSNFDGFKFKINKEFSPKPREKCYICDGAFDELGVYAKKAAAKSKDIGFDNFSVGSVLPGSVLNREEEMWELVGIEHVESIKFDLNRELRKKVSEELSKPVEFANPDVMFIADFENKEVSVAINSIFHTGRLQEALERDTAVKVGDARKVQDVGAGDSGQAASEGYKGKGERLPRFRTRGRRCEVP
jgi:tRNA pseudouridine(54/55) synthase